MIDNFNLILPLLKFDDPDLFYFISIIKRKKDNPDMDNDNKNIKNFYICDNNKFLQRYNIMKEWARLHNARIYIRLNRRSFKAMGPAALIKTMELIRDGHSDKIKGIYESIAGKTNSEPKKTWLVDIDKRSADLVSIKAYISYNTTYCTEDDPIFFHEIPTKNGLHLITRPFNLWAFKDNFPEIDIHKDNPTLLFCP